MSLKNSFHQFEEISQSLNLQSISGQRKQRDVSEVAANNINDAQQDERSRQGYRYIQRQVFHSKGQQNKQQKKTKLRKKQKPKNSLFPNHNFQKHTVITVKKLGGQLTQLYEKSEAELLANRIWQSFLINGINTKKSLLILFGKANFNIEKCKQLFRETYLGQVCSYDQKIVQKAQDLLRQSFLKIIDHDIIRAHMKGQRNIYHKEEFIAYFCQFIEQLRKGPYVQIRINKQFKKKIENRLKIGRKLNKVQAKRKKEYVYQQLK